MKKLKNYKDSPLLRILNAVVEWVIIVIAYYVSAFLRKITPLFLASSFSFRDAISFSVIAYISGLFSVLIYFLLGDYKTIHYRRLSSETSRVMIVQLISGYFISALLYWIRGGQFSRMWLLLYILITFLMLMIKRIAFHELADRLFGKYLKQTCVLVIGNGSLAARYMEALSELPGNRTKIKGYLAESENVDIPGYLGTTEQLETVLHQDEITELVIADSAIKQGVFQEILGLCHVYRIQAYVIPMFNDYLTGMISTNYREDVPGLCLFPVDVMRVNDVLGVHVAVTNMEQTIEMITKNLDNWRGKYICVSNVHTTVMAYEDETYRKIQNGAVLRLPDGGPLSAYSRREGNHTAMRVTGPDLMHTCLQRSGAAGWRHFFYGSSEQTLQKLEERITQNFPDVAIAGMIAPPFRELTKEEDEAYIREINEAKPDFVWVGLGAPKQERWMADHQDKISALMIGVGAAFDFESGNVKRAPGWMQKLNLEWLYRLAQDPGRLMKRYVSTNFRYLWLTRK